ncbi:MAG: tetratricopeptide repeat protein [Candidatus Erginobacter occultus]|nr:tetratricopeptide repeat protein [Candidatus Erginobacter occultus]
MKKSVFIILTAAILCAAAAAAENPEDPLPAGVAAFTAAYAEWDGDGFRRAAEQLQAAGMNEPESFPAHYWHGVASFHFALFLLDLEDPGPEVDRALDSAEEALEKALELEEDCGECYALLSVITGLRIGRNPLSGIWRGSRFKKQAEAALRLSPDNPRVHYLIGTSHYHGPDRADSRERARDHFLKAKSLYERERRTPAGGIQPSWGYDSTLAFLGDIYREGGDREEAREYYDRTLVINPENGRAQRGLMELKISEESDE